MSTEETNGVPVVNGEVVPPAQSGDPLLNKVTDWVSDQTEVDAATRAALESVATSNHSKLNLYRQVLGMHKAQHLTKLSGFMGEIEDKLYNKEKIGMIQDPVLLLRLLSQLHDMVKEESNFIKELAGPTGATTPATVGLLHSLDIQAEGSEEAELIQKMAPQKREKIRKLTDKLHARRLEKERNGTS